MFILFINMNMFLLYVQKIDAQLVHVQFFNKNGHVLKPCPEIVAFLSICSFDELKMNRFFKLRSTVDQQDHLALDRLTSQGLH